jgi:hypothetical protein
MSFELGVSKSESIRTEVLLAHWKTILIHKSRKLGKAPSSMLNVTGRSSRVYIAVKFTPAWRQANLVVVWPACHFEAVARLGCL